MHILINLLIIFGISLKPFHSEITVKCGNDWHEYSDKKCIKVLFNDNDLVSFNDAQQKCSQNENSSLLTIHSEDENEFIITLFYSKYNVGNNVWIGAQYHNNALKWDDNSPVNYTNLLNTSLENGGQISCVEMLYNITSLGKWVLESCDNKNVVVCQRYQSTTETETVLNRTQSALNLQMNETNGELISKNNLILNRINIIYNYLNYANGCLLSDVWFECKSFIDNTRTVRQIIAKPKNVNKKYEKTWNEAVNVCAKYNASLISIESEEKQKIIELFAGSSKTYWTSGRKNSDRKWIWNSSGNEFTFTKWQEFDSPNDANIECLSIYKNYWYDDKCESKYGVLCEFDV